MSEAVPERRLSKLSMVPVALSRAAWVFILITIVAIAYSSPSPSGNNNAQWVFGWVWPAAALLAFGCSLGSLGVGGLSFLRVQLDPSLRGRGLALLGCFTALPPLIALLSPLVCMGAFLIYLFSTWGKHGSFIW